MTDVPDIVRRALADRYDLERELGGGGMSRVFVVVERQLRRREVLKLLPPEQAGAVSTARFAREIALAARLQHPHIVPLVGAGEIEGIPYFTMPLVEGESLRSRLERDGEFPVAEAIRLLREMASALEYAHAQGVVHRDIKPENILLTQGIAVVTDFGVAKALIDSTTFGRGPLTTVGTSVGTPAYMSPEQATADPALDHRSDVYSLGVVAYELLCGQGPFTARTTQALIAAHVTEAPVPVQTRRPSVPPGLASLVMRCLEKRAADRPQTASEIVRELDQLVGADVSSAARTPARVMPPERGAPPAREGRRAWWIGGVGIAVAAALVGWVVMRPGGLSGIAGAGAQSSKLLIAPFEDLTGDPRFANVGRIASNQLTHMVAQVDESAVVPAASVGLALDGTTREPLANLQRVAREQRAGLLMTGSVLVRGDSVVVEGAMTDVETGKSVVAFEPVTGPSADPVVALEAMGDRLLSALRSRRDLSGLPQGFRPPSYAAQQHFVEGFRKFSKEGNQIAARQDFLLAVAADSTYVQAYLLIVRLDLNRGDFASVDTLLQILDRVPGRRTLAERTNIAFVRAEMRGQRREHLRAVNELAALDSSAVALGLVASAAVGMLQPRLALRASEARAPQVMALGRMATGTWVTTMGEAYHLLGEHEQELKHALAADSTAIEPFQLQFTRMRAYAGLRRGAEALALSDTMARQASFQASSILLEAADEFWAHGDTATSARLLGRAATGLAAARSGSGVSPIGRGPAARGGPPTKGGPPTRGGPPSRGGPQAKAGPPAVGFMDVAIPLRRGQLDSAIALLTPLARDTTRTIYVGLLGLAEAQRGNTAGARAIAEALEARTLPWQFGTSKYWSGAIRAALGEPERAMALLRRAHEEGARLNRWHAAWELGPMRGYGPFVAFIKPNG
jgi:TolB-like protein